MATITVENVSSQRICGLEPGTSGALDVAVLNSPPFLAGLLSQTNITGDGALSDIITVTTGTFTSTVAATTKLFTITGGEIELLDLYGCVTTALGATASNGSFQTISNTGPTTTALCTTTSIASTPAGKYLMMPSAVGSALIVSNVGESAVNGKGTLLLMAGEIDFVTSGNTTGALTFTMRYRKIGAFASVSAAF